MDPDDPFDLQRFVEAQKTAYTVALEELRAGEKRSHWMWFTFPQLRGLGSSPTSTLYGIRSIKEAKAYLRHPSLGARLTECTEAVLAIQDKSVHYVFGSPDDQKFWSSMTLFSMATGASPSSYSRALERFFDGQRDPGTLARLATKSTILEV